MGVISIPLLMIIIPPMVSLGWGHTKDNRTTGKRGACMTKSGSTGGNGEHRNGNRSARISSSRSRHASVILDLTGSSDR